MTDSLNRLLGRGWASAATDNFILCSRKELQHYLFSKDLMMCCRESTILYKALNGEKDLGHQIIRSTSLVLTQSSHSSPA